MPTLELLLQGVTDASHASAIRKILLTPGASRVLISVAFMRERGVRFIENELSAVAALTTVFVGVRNDITTVQAVRRLLELKIAVFAVDTGSRRTIFHPKLYFIESPTEARAIVGSANLTRGGLRNNVELSTLVRLNLADAQDKAFADAIKSAVTQMQAGYPDHVFRIKDIASAEQLFNSGRLADEDEVPAPSPTSSVKSGSRDNLLPMKLIRGPEPVTGKSAQSPGTKTAPKSAAAAGTAKPNPSKAVKKSGRLAPILVWESKPLSERDLSIPSGETTNPTGSMGWKKGAFDIDQRHYFRDEVFAELDWEQDANGKLWERAHASFELVIKNLNYGAYSLQLSHNMDKKSKSYRQSNFMTQLHWGTAKVHIARSDLLGRTLSLYRKNSAPPTFVIEID